MPRDNNPGLQYLASAPMHCPGDDTITMLVCGQLGGAQVEAIEAHVGTCSSCKQLVGALKGTPGGSSDGGHDKRLHESMLGLVAPGTPVGRYQIERMLGAGGMGVVYAAHDPELDRDVALKLLYPMIRSDAQTGEDERAASLRHESKAMAKLRHPNVATIYDLGQFRDQLFFVMELVQGTTLRAWVGTTRPWQDVVATFIDAGKGLSAAHDAGIVHCDFKPDNVLVDASGRPSITDFGLAQMVAGTRARPGVPQRATAIGSSTMIEVESGCVFGTPAYMAPERFDTGTIPDVQSDVFAFCVSLYEVLVGQRPFAGASVDELRESMTAPPSVSAVRDELPGWLLETIGRGLAWDRETRFRTMTEVLAALEPPAAPPPPPPRRSKSRWPMVTAATVVAAGAIVGGVAWQRSGGTASVDEVRLSHPDTCDGTAELARIWDDTSKAAIAVAWQAKGNATTAKTWQRLSAAMDRYTQSWAEASTLACRNPSTAPGVADFQLRCLRSHKVTLRSVIEQIAKADTPKAMGASDRMVANLPALDDCAREAPALPMPTDPGVRQKVDTLRDELAAADATSIAGKFEPAGIELDRLVKEATAVGFKPLVAEIMYIRALNLRGASAKPEDTTAALRDAAVAAQASGNELVAARAWIALAFQAGDVVGDFARGREYASYAAAALERLGGNRKLETELETTRGRIDWHDLKLDAARKEYEHAIELAKDSPKMRIEALSGLALVDNAGGQLAKALDENLQILALRRNLYGEDHPEVARSYTTLGDTTMRMGKLDDSLAYYQKADATAVKVYGPEHSIVQITAHNLGGILRELQRGADAEREFRRAVKIGIAAFGPDHPYVAKSQQSLGMALFDQNKLSDALVELRHAYAIKQKAYGEDHVETIGVMNDLSIVLRGAGQFAEALALIDKAITGYTKVSPNSDDLGQAYAAKTRTYIAMNKRAEATAALAKTAAVWEHIETAPQRKDEIVELRKQIAALR